MTYCTRLSNVIEEIKRQKKRIKKHYNRARRKGRKHKPHRIIYSCLRGSYRKDFKLFYNYFQMSKNIKVKDKVNPKYLMQHFIRFRCDNAYFRKSSTGLDFPKMYEDFDGSRSEYTMDYKKVLLDRIFKDLLKG
jgi:hypothetical protein